MDDHDYDEYMKVIHQAHEDAIKRYLEKPNSKLDESLKDIIDMDDMEFFLLSMLVLTDNFLGKAENKPKEERK